MKLTTEFTKLEKSAVKLTVTIAKKDVEESYKSTLSKYVKNAQIPGFRKGHVPASVLERKFGESIKADSFGELIDNALNEVFEKETENRPLPYAQPMMEQVPELDMTKDLTFSVTYDVFPNVEIKSFSGVSVKEPQVTITEDDIAEELKGMQERNAMVIDKKDNTVEKDNIVTINYAELDDDGKVIDGTTREDFVFTVGTGENIYKIDDEIIGMKKDETKEITKKYKKDDADPELAGKTKKITVTVKAVKVRDLPALDDDFAQDVSEKYKTLIKIFKAKRSREIENEKRREKRRLARIEKGY